MTVQRNATALPPHITRIVAYDRRTDGRHLRTDEAVREADLAVAACAEGAGAVEGETIASRQEAQVDPVALVAEEVLDHVATGTDRAVAGCRELEPVGTRIAGQRVVARAAAQQVAAATTGQAVLAVAAQQAVVALGAVARRQHDAAHVEHVDRDAAEHQASERAASVRTEHDQVGADPHGEGRRRDGGGAGVKLGSLELTSPFILSPMESVSDAAHRRLCWSLGAGFTSIPAMVPSLYAAVDPRIRVE